MRLQKDLTELVEAGLITEEKAEEITLFYEKKKESQPNRLMMVFALLGAILFGLGVISILAHNWDEFSRNTKGIISFIPLLLGQISVLYVILRKYDQNAWRESSSVLLFFGIGSSIALISQVYNIPGNTSTFLLTWMALALPLVYLMKSSITSLLYIATLTYYANIFHSNFEYDRRLYWPFLVLILPHYYLILKNRPESNAVKWHHWLIPISLIFCLHTVIKVWEENLVLLYILMFGLFYQLGSSFPVKKHKHVMSYGFFGVFGSIITLLIVSFDYFWEWFAKKDFTYSELWLEGFGSATLLVLAGILLVRKIKSDNIKSTSLMDWTFLIFIIIYLVGKNFWIPAVIMVNLLVLALGITTVIEGSRKNHLGVLNYGLLIILALVVCRFFDENLSFVVRGLLFLGTGIAFWLANYRLIKKRKANE